MTSVVLLENKISEQQKAVIRFRLKKEDYEKEFDDMDGRRRMTFKKHRAGGDETIKPYHSLRKGKK
ncbi:MAG: hypothetical protein Q4G07_10325 [Oscillospiraceae bacterium]|nr:hypothetical protein [Oscillospiraceae bacterium]